MNHLPTSQDILIAHQNLPKSLVRETPLVRHDRLSELYGAEIFYKDEGKQLCRSYKGRGAGNGILSTPLSERNRGFVCASAGNHSQGFGLACKEFKVNGTVFMPLDTSAQKVDATKRLGGQYVQVRQTGDFFDDTYQEALRYREQTGAIFIHPFDSKETIAGQGTVAVEIVQQMERMGLKVDILFAPVGGGGLVSGVSEYFKDFGSTTKIVGIEAKEAAAMHASIQAGKLTTLQNGNFSSFIEGAAVKTPGKLPFEMVQRNNVEIRTVPQNRVCRTMLDLHQIDGIITEPAGALSFDALQDAEHEMRGRVVVCILSGTNFDMNRTNSVLLRAKIFDKNERYFSIRLPNRPGALNEVTALLKTLGLNIPYIHFNERHSEPTLILGTSGKENKSSDAIVQILVDTHFLCKEITDDPQLENLLH